MEVNKMDKDLTTISVTNKTKDRLEELKIHPNQSFDEVIVKILADKK